MIIPGIVSAQWIVSYAPFRSQATVTSENMPGQFYSQKDFDSLLGVQVINVSSEWWTDFKLFTSKTLVEQKEEQAALSLY